MTGHGPENARPRTPEEIGLLSHQPAIVEEAQERGVTEVLHFTTTKNLVGILASSVKCRNLVSADHYVKAVYDPNCANRSGDAEWTGYVNASISRINTWMFGSSQRWHTKEEARWVILAFDPVILGHPGVVFTTTNNVYEVCERAEGLEGFKMIFEEGVVGYRGPITRHSLDPRYPTDHCAEVLYPVELSLEHLNTIYVQHVEDQDHIHGILTLRAAEQAVTVKYNPRMFL